MKQKALGIALFIVLVGGLVVGVLWVLKPTFFKNKLTKTSDASNVSETIRMGGDDYYGYFFLTAQETRSQLAAQGMQVNYVDDGGNYADRLKKFADDEYDAIVLPVKEYLQHGKAHGYPGVITMGIAESRGADGLTVLTNRVPSATVKALNNPNLKFVYTDASPSEFLVDFTVADFGLNQLRASSHWRVPVGSCKEVFERLKRGEGDVFVLWEPYLSEALRLPNVQYVWGSDKAAGYIIDVVVFRRDYVDKKHEQVLNFLKAYFRSLDTYESDQGRLIQEVEENLSSRGFDKSIAPSIVKKIDWFDLRENLEQQFAIPATPGAPARDGIVNTIIACRNAMIRMGRIQSDPLPEGNPLFIINSSFLKELASTGVAPVSVGGSQITEFLPLTDGQWKQLQEVGSLRLEQITFQRGTNYLDDFGKTKVDELAQLLANNYPGYRILVRGHTAPGDDESDNLRLSTERAEVVKQRLIAVHAINENRVYASGVGSSMPPPSDPTIPPRERMMRLARVEFVLLEKDFPL
ncbi:MAG: phosphate ABC transporter substrate-binding/OmpA family protein [bacterium]|nr:phosphate ABC transporter substrate-binding/OmpA family protein [bacterium]